VQDQLDRADIDGLVEVAEELFHVPLSGETEDVASTG
jgi:hypothetical protein